jgi:hypothetical protein
VPLADSNKVVLGIFGALAISSLGLKAAAGPPQDGFADPRPLATEARLTAILRAQGFGTGLSPRRYQSSVVYAERGGCRLSARRARGDDAENAVYAHEAAPIGPVRYLYAGRRYASAPTLKIRIGRLETELLGRMGLKPNIHVPIAVATSSGCGTRDFGLEDVQVPA